MLYFVPSISPQLAKGSCKVLWCYQEQGCTQPKDLLSVQFPYEVLACSKKTIKQPRKTFHRTIEEKAQFTNRTFKVLHRLKLRHFVCLQVQIKWWELEETLCIRDSRKMERENQKIYWYGL